MRGSKGPPPMSHLQAIWTSMWHTSRNGGPDQMVVVRLERYGQFILNILLSILCINQFSDQFLILQRSTKEKKEENKND